MDRNHKNYPDCKVGRAKMVHNEVSKGCSNKIIIVGVEAGVVALTAVAAIVLVSVHFGPKITTEAYKVVHQTFKSDEGDVFEEEINVTKTEVDVRISNMADVIYDYEHGIVVTRFVDRESNTQSECIAQHMNETEAPSLDPNEYSNGEVDIHQKKDNEADKQEWVRTDTEVPQYLVSEKVEGMCRGTKIYWMKKVQRQSDVVEKRQTCTSYFRYAVCILLSYTRMYICDFRVYCTQTGRLG
ncbi:uncharacterized protein LOC132721150 [Ruditapes philippinarum]|uniref:uncharacterized protein LOC132721150 n=1 Tax=Ruditapes philippinarum TaxID=129788 RepID=UPI00295B9977|nr:uncharacterized protein LOC132721150 [Ruditapes philippinarum]